nr:hypothetical protein [uncultured Psychroserpens sp.]
MKIIVAFLLCSFNVFAQDTYDLSREVHVNCYYNNDVKTPILIYDNINGKVVDTLYNSEDKNAWYKLTILESDYGWFKIKRLSTPTEQFNYENYWVKSQHFLVSVDSSSDNKNIYLYDLPSTKANKIHKLDDFQKVSVTEVDGNWSKVKFKVGKKEIEGWLGFEYQIANPWINTLKSD